MSSTLIVGASSGVGRALVTAFASQGFRVAAVAREPRDLEATVIDANLRFTTECFAITQDIAVLDWDAEEFVTQCWSKLDGIDSLLLPVGAVSDDDQGANSGVLMPLTAVNYLGPARLAAAVGRRMAARGHGSIVFFSSIAASAPRPQNAAYSAAKAALDTYAKALRCSLEPHGVKVHVIALGYVDTQLSFGMPLKFPLATPEQVASYVLTQALARGGRSYFPSFWWMICTVLRHLPWFIYRRLSF